MAGSCPQGDVWRTLGECFSSVWPVGLAGLARGSLAVGTWLSRAGFWLLFAFEFGLLQASPGSVQVGKLLDKELHCAGAVPCGHVG